MLRVIALMLVVVTGAAQVAHAQSRSDGLAVKGITTALQHTRINAGNTGLQLQIGLALTPTGQAHRRGSGLLDLAGTEWQERDGEGARLDWRRSAFAPDAGGKPSLAYPVTSALSLGLDYRYQSGESMNFKVAKVGGLEPNYHSHNFMIEARLEF
jgi:opacity protein-like surface antigen